MSVKSMEDSFVYKMFNVNNKVANTIGTILQKGKILSKANLEEPLFTIHKNFKFPLKQQVLKAFEDGQLVLVYAPDNVRLPNALPFFLTRNSNGALICVVSVDLYGTMNAKEEVTIDAKKLYTIMEAGLIAMKYYTGAQKYSTNRAVIDGCGIYSNIFIKPLNKKYSLNVDKVKLHKILFLASKFYLISILGLKNSDIVTNYAIGVCKNANPILLREVDDTFREESYKDLSTFISALADPKAGLGMSDLTVRGYLESFINMFDGSTVLSLEMFPYFMYTCNAVTHGSYLNNQYLLEDILDKKGAKLYNVFVG